MLLIFLLLLTKQVNWHILKPNQIHFNSYNNWLNKITCQIILYQEWIDCLLEKPFISNILKSYICYLKPHKLILSNIN